MFRGPSWCLACCCFFHRPANRSARALHTARAPTGCCNKPRLLLYARFVIGCKYHVKNNTSLKSKSAKQKKVFTLIFYYWGKHYRSKTGYDSKIVKAKFNSLYWNNTGQILSGLCKTWVFNELVLFFLTCFWVQFMFRNFNIKTAAVKTAKCISDTVYHSVIYFC